MQLEVILPLVAYLVVVFGISVYAMRKRSTGTFLNEYFLGSRSMGGIVLAMTLTATYISASSFIGGPGAAYKYGLGWVLLAMIQLPAVWLSLGILGKKFAILARRYNAVTLNDMLFARYQSRLLVWLASLSLLVAFVGAMTVQFIGGARLLETAAGIPYETGLLIFGISIALYTAFGGFRASVLNDTMQGLVMLIGTVVLLIGVVHAAGGLSNAVQTLQTIDPQLVTPQGADDILSPAFMTSFWVLVCFGVIGLPHTAVRCISYKDSKAVHRGIIIGTIVVAILMFGMHLAGALGRAVIPDLTVPDLVIPTLMVKVLPPFAAGIFLAAPMAAIMSTINAQLLQSSATIIKDLYLNIRPDQMQNETRLKRMSAVITLVLGALLLLAAWKPPEMIIWLNLLAFGGLEAVFLWPLVLGLYWERANAKGALSAMIVGGVLYAVLATLNIQYLGFHPIVPSLLLSLLAFLVGNRFGTSVPQATVLTTDNIKSFAMPWIQLKLNTTGANAEDLSDALMEAGAVSITFQDTHDTPVFEPLPGETRLWGDTDVIGLFDAETDMNDVVAILENHPLLGAGFAHKIEQLEDKDWEREWMDNFHPMRFGERLWICPSWRDVPDENAVNVMLDPGLAFGTGTHPTTSLCLQWLDSLDLTGKTVIDFGCGSGILAIAALKLGAAKAIGIDIDPQAIQASRDNAERNGVSDRLELYLPKDQPEEMKADVVVANILAGPLRELAPLISVLPVSGGLLGLSGILASQAESVCEAYADSFALDPVVEKEEWCRITGRKN